MKCWNCCRTCTIHDGRLDLPLITYRGNKGRQIRTINQLIILAETWERKWRARKSRLVLETFALHLGRIGGAARLGAMGVSPLVIQQEKRWSSNAFMMYERTNNPFFKYSLVNNYVKESKMEGCVDNVVFGRMERTWVGLGCGPGNIPCRFYVDYVR